MGRCTDPRPTTSAGDPQGESFSDGLCRGLDLLEESVIVADEQGNVVFVNRAARRRARVEGSREVPLIELAERLAPRPLAARPPTLRPVPHLERLSVREREVLQAFLEGFGTQTIAQRLGLTPSTIRNHLKNASRKLGVRSQVQLRELFARAR